MSLFGLITNDSMTFYEKSEFLKENNKVELASILLGQKFEIVEIEMLLF